MVPIYLVCVVGWGILTVYMWWAAFKSLFLGPYVQVGALPCLNLCSIVDPESFIIPALTWTQVLRQKPPGPSRCADRVSFLFWDWALMATLCQCMLWWNIYTNPDFWLVWKNQTPWLLWMHLWWPQVAGAGPVLYQLKITVCRNQLSIHITHIVMLLGICRGLDYRLFVSSIFIFEDQVLFISFLYVPPCGLFVFMVLWPHVLDKHCKNWPIGFVQFRSNIAIQ